MMDAALHRTQTYAIAASFPSSVIFSSLFTPRPILPLFLALFPFHLFSSPPNSSVYLYYKHLEILFRELFSR